MKSIIDQRPWLNDPLAIRKPWAEDEYQLTEHGSGKQLCFAIIWDDGQIKPHPPIRRGLQAVKDALLKAGHRGMISFLFLHMVVFITFIAVIDWEPLRHKEIMAVWVSLERPNTPSN